MLDFSATDGWRKTPLFYNTVIIFPDTKFTLWDWSHKLLKFYKKSPPSLQHETLGSSKGDLWCTNRFFLLALLNQVLENMSVPLTVKARICLDLESSVWLLRNVGRQESKEKHSTCLEMLLCLKDEQNLTESVPLTPNNFMSLITELIYSLLLFITWLKSCTCGLYAARHSTPPESPRTSILHWKFTFPRSALVYIKCRLLSYTQGNRWVEQLAWEVSSLTTEKISG